MDSRTIGTMENAHAEYGAACAKVQELKTQLGRMESEERDIERQIRGDGKSRFVSAIEIAARKLLGGGGLSFSADSQKVQAQRAQLEALAGNKAVVRKAIELAEEIVRDLRWPARHAIQAKGRPIADEIAGRFVKQLAELGETLEEAEALRSAMQDAGVEGLDIYIPNLSGVSFERGRVSGHSSIGDTLHEAVRLDAIKPSDIPQVWREAWKHNRQMKTAADVAREHEEHNRREQAKTKAEQDRLARAAAAPRRR